MYKLLLVPCLLLVVTAVSASRSITVAPGFSYYKDRSPQSIAEEISVNGFDDVRLISADSSQMDDGC